VLPSNAPAEVAAALAASPLSRLFEQLIFSCDIALAKPDPRCFLAALARLDAAAGEILVVDDRLDNVEAPGPSAYEVCCSPTSGVCGPTSPKPSRTVSPDREGEFEPQIVMWPPTRLRGESAWP
jgi:hypothetical protein